MYQVKVYNRSTSEVIMESDTFDSLEDADKLLFSIGQGEGYYSIVFKLNALWSDLDSMVTHQARLPPTPISAMGQGYFLLGGRGE